MPRKQLPTIVYTYRGMVERVVHRPDRRTSYRWVPGYSAASRFGKGWCLYPWRTRRECQLAARAAGKRALFETVHNTTRETR